METWNAFRICVITDLRLWLVPGPDSLGLSCHTEVCLVLLLVLDFLQLESKNRFFLLLSKGISVVALRIVLAEMRAYFP